MRNNPLSFFPDSFPFQVYYTSQTIWWSTDSEYLDRAKIFGEKSVGRMKEEALTDTEKLKSLISLKVWLVITAMSLFLQVV